MKLKNMLVGMLLVLAVGGMGYFGNRYLGMKRLDCDLCGRPVHAVHFSTVVLKNGSPIHTCCPRCALHYEHYRPGQVARILVSDRISGRQIMAENAIYVEGSDDQSCRSVEERAPSEPGVKYDLKYDRCLPSLVAFKDEAAARGFQAAHGGRVLNYQKVLESVTKQ